MTNALVLAVTHQPDVASAWRSLVKPNDRVGIKISAAGGELFTTHREIVDTIVDGLVAAGHSRANIIVWDRSLGGIKDAGYSGNEGYQLRSVTPRDGYDAKATISAPYLGNLIWGDFEYVGGPGEMPLLSETENTSSVSHLSKIVANEVTKIINVPVMSDNVRNGLAGCLYNVTIPNVDNWRRFGTRPAFGGSSIPEIYADPHIGSKVVLGKTSLTMLLSAIRLRLVYTKYLYPMLRPLRPLETWIYLKLKEPPPRPRPDSQAAQLSAQRASMDAARQEMENIKRGFAGTDAQASAEEARARQLAQDGKLVDAAASYQRATSLWRDAVQKDAQRRDAAQGLEADRQSIRRSLDQYKTAYQAKNMSGIRAVFPTIPSTEEGSTRNNFDIARSIQMSLDLGANDIQISGDTARVTAQQRFEIRSKENQTVRSEARIVFSLRKSNGSWLIQSITRN